MRNLIWIVLVALGLQCQARQASMETSYYQDFQVFKKALIENHPSLYRFTPKSQFQQLFDSIDSRLMQETTGLEFFRMLAKVEALIREGHSYITPSETLKSKLMQAKSFPLDIAMIDNKMIVLASRSPNYTHLIGAEVTSINGQSIHALFEYLKQSCGYKSAFNPAGLYNTLSLYSNFALAYYLYLDTTDEFQIEYQSHENKSENDTLEGTAVSIAYGAFPKFLPEPDPPFQFTINKALSTAEIKITTFAHWVVSASVEDYKQFFQDCFQSMDEQNIENLIIDLRNNRGGEEMIGGELLTYLVDEEFKVYKYVKAKTLNFKSLNKLKGVTKVNLVKKHYQQTDSGFYLTKGDILKVYVPKEKYHFSGKTYMLSNGSSRSATNVLLALSKSHGVATLVGTESGGAYEDIDGRIHTQFLLPLSKHLVGFPVWTMKLNVQGENPNRGVKPHHEVFETKQDLLGGTTDNQLSYIYQLIQSKKY